MAKARNAAREALELDPNLAEAHVTRAYIEFLRDWDWQASERDFLKAIELDPDYVVAHQWYSEFLGVMGRHDEGIVESIRAVALEPTSSLQLRVLGNSYRQAGRYAEAIEHLNKADELDDSHQGTLYYLTQTYWESGMHAEAIVAANRWDERWGRFYGFLAEGKPHEALPVLEEFAEDEINDELWVYSYVLAGENEKALGLLEELFRRRDVLLPPSLTDNILDPIAEEPRVVEIRRSIGLEP